MSEDQRTVFCGNISEKVTEEILFELFLQAGPLDAVRIPKDKDGRQRSFAFVVFKHESSVPYAIALFEGTALYNKVLQLKSRQVPNEKNFGNMSHQRAYSAPVNSNSKPSASPDFHHLLQFGQQMLNPGMRPSDPVTGLRNLYESQRGASNYLGAPFHLNSLQGNWSSRNHPYSVHGNGQKRKSSDRDRNYRREHRNSDRKGFSRY
ncbi:RNA-binding protein 7 [Schistocerca nitens]|uniref:RNA-binding protein 7 n=1 Tax=Schistocerca nitens TaxID=7011 RepID=UPI0021193B99|nr:RNA-binding protein 7 [Schistocerca nitens]